MRQCDENYPLCENSDIEEDPSLPLILDEDESSLSFQPPRQPLTQSSSYQSLKQSTGPGSDVPSLVQDKGYSPSPSTEDSLGTSTYSSLGLNVLPAILSGWQKEWTSLPTDVRFFVQYFTENVTHHHYALKHDHNNFLHTTYLDMARTNEALLYAIVGFSAFQMTLTNPNGRIQDFLQYYNKAVSLLLRFLKRQEKPTLATLLSILQLATIEEYLGDWMNLLGHQKAAYQILTGIFTPETVMHHDTTRITLAWYMRFDLYGSILGRFKTVLSREWFSAYLDDSRRRLAQEPENIPLKIEEAFANIRLIAMDMSLLFARLGAGTISIEQFTAENNVITQRMAAWKTYMDPALTDSRYYVNDFSNWPQKSPHSIVDPFTPGVLFHGRLAGMNLANIDYLSIDLMHKHQTSEVLKIAPGPELTEKAYSVFQLYEAMELWPGSPKGITVACQQSVGIAAIFLPPDEKHRMYCRRKLAGVECAGYIYPESFRAKLAALFQDKSCLQWWLPNGEMLTPIVRSLHAFASERKAPAKDYDGEGLRDMRAVLASLSLDDKED